MSSVKQMSETDINNSFKELFDKIRNDLGSLVMDIQNTGHGWRVITRSEFSLEDARKIKTMIEKGIELLDR